MSKRNNIVRSKENNTDCTEHDLMRPCCIEGCDRSGSRLLSSLRESYHLKQTHSGRVCEGHYRRDLRAFKRKKTGTSLTKQNLMNTVTASYQYVLASTSPPRIKEESLSPPPFIFDLRINKSYSEHINNSYTPNLTQNEQQVVVETSCDQIISTSDPEHEFNSDDSTDLSAPSNQIFMEVNDDDDGGDEFVNDDDDSEDFQTHNSRHKLSRRYNTRSTMDPDPSRFRTFCDFILKAECFC